MVAGAACGCGVVFPLFFGGVPNGVRVGTGTHLPNRPPHSIAIVY